MVTTRDDGVRALRESAAAASAIRVDVDAAYLRAIAHVESLAANQSGANKTWVGLAQEGFRQHYRNARRV